MRAVFEIVPLRENLIDEQIGECKTEYAEAFVQTVLNERLNTQN